MSDESFDLDLFKQLRDGARVARAQTELAKEKANTANQELIFAKSKQLELESKLYEEFGRWIDQP